MSGWTEVQSWPAYGYRHVTAELHGEGHIVNHKRVMRLNCRSSVESTQTTSKPAGDVAPGSVWTIPAYGPDGVRHRGSAIYVELREPSVAMASEWHKPARRGGK